MHRTKIINGSVLDGSGDPPKKTDILIEGERVVDTGALADIETDETLDASGLIVAPGFIDVHTHSDAYILLEPNAPSKIHQGVTTEVVGNCGASCAPIYGEARIPSDWTAQTYPGTWQTVGEYSALFDSVTPALNIVFQVGHNTLRAGVIGYEARPAKPDEVKLMVKRLEQAMDEGACGLSTGLVYIPGRFAATTEVNALTAAVAKRQGIYSSHMRSESSKLIEAIDETIGFGRATGVQVHISHLKASGQANWHLLETAIERIHHAQAEGIGVAADRYPYTAACTDLDIIFPDWVMEDGPSAILERLQHPATRQKLLDELLTKTDDYWPTITIGSTANPANQDLQGLPLTAVARRWQCQPAEAVLRLAISDGLRTTAFFHTMSETNMLRVLNEPYVMIGSDASIRAPTGPLSHDWPHPRAYGTFPRFLRMALDGQTVSLPEAIRKMTSLAAETFHLPNRGIIKKGAFADITIFDPATVRDHSAFDKPHALAEGIRHVIINGAISLRNGQITDHRRGQFLA